MQPERHSSEEDYLLVVGDILLDHEAVGSVTRVSPESPCLVVDLLDQFDELGGAARVAACASQRVPRVKLLAATSCDAPSTRIATALRALGIDVVVLHSSNSTPVKSRIRADSHTLLMLDDARPATNFEAHVLDSVASLVMGATCIVASDSGRRLLANSMLRQLLSRASAQGIPVVWDPRRSGLAPTHGVALVTPNQHELLTYTRQTGLRPSDDAFVSDAERAQTIQSLVQYWNADIVVTLGSEGAELFQRNRRRVRFPAPSTTIVDVKGAGDAFAAAAATALFEGRSAEQAIQLAVRLASESVGKHPSRLLRIRQTLAQSPGSRGHVATSGCFDLLHPGHVSCLQHAREQGSRLVVLLNSDESVARLKGSGRPVVSQHDRRNMLLALSCVDEVVVFNEQEPLDVFRAIRPDVYVKGAEYRDRVIPEIDAMHEWAGRVDFSPHYSDFSTTGIISSVSQTLWSEVE